jgi:peptidoglycan/xylan/chitin deacetylase (PgdA/CDA1 family)
MRYKHLKKATKFWLLFTIFFSPIVSNQDFYTFQKSSDKKSSQAKPFPASAIILQYHHISDNTPYSTSTSVALFKKQMQLLKKLRFRVWPLSRIINKLRNGESLPEKVVALSFDDAYSSFYSNAWPILKEYQYPAIIFVATTHITEQTNEYLSWKQLKYLSTQGVEIGSHSDSHDYLARQLYSENTPQRLENIRKDLQLSLDKIEQNLIISTRFFAYPYGEYSDALVKLIESLNLIGFGQHSGPINQFSNFSALPRFPASNQFGDIKTLREKLFTIPFSDISAQPTETFIRENPPKLILTLGNKNLNINCYASNQGTIPAHKIIHSKDQQYIIQATKPLEIGRSRYNCTAKANEQYFFWFSQPWIRLD